VSFCDQGSPKVRNSVRLTAAVRADIDLHRRTIAALFKGDHCRYGGRPIDWRHDGAALPDRTGALQVSWRSALISLSRLASSTRLVTPSFW
jgi:hypothetical protein